jgi:hypothetical protein
LPTVTRSGYCLPAVATATMRHGFMAHDDRVAGRARDRHARPRSRAHGR